MLTPAERTAARTAPSRLGVGHGYGTPAVGYCPIGAVAVLRGYRFFRDAEGEYAACSQDRAGCALLRRATEDVLGWSGYPTLGSFLQAWETYGAAILPSEE